MNKWYTLAELLVVIAIIMILATAATGILSKWVGEYEKLERLRENIVSILRTEDLYRTSGKNVIIGWVAQYPDSTRIQISTDSGVITEYYSSAWVLLGTGSVFTPPFYQDKQYRIDNIILGGSSYSGADIRFFRNGSNTISVLDNPSITGTWVTVAVSYGSRTGSILFDKRTGRIEKE